MNAFARFSGRLGRFITIYSLGLVGQLVFGLATTVLVVHYLSPSEYGLLGLYLLVPSTLMVIANIGLLQATNKTIFVHAGGEESRRDTPAGETVRRVLGTGLCISFASGFVFAGIAFIFDNQISTALGGNYQGGAQLVQIGAVSGALAGGWRLASNILRYARRPVAWGIVHVSRAAFSLIVIAALLANGGGLESVIVGFALGTFASFLLALWASRRDIKYTFDRRLALEILHAVKGWVVIVLAYQVILGTGIYFVSLNSSATEVGLFSLATSLAVAAHYTVSAFIYSWGPLSRSVLRVAVIQEDGEAPANGALFEGFVVVGSTIVLMLALFAPEMVAIAPHSYAGAAALVPLVALTPLGRGYFALSYSLSPRHDVSLFRRMAAVSMVVYIVLALVLGHVFKAYGVALAGAIAFAVTGTVQMVLTQRSETPLPLTPRRLALPPLLGAALVTAAVLVNPPVGWLAISAQVAVVIAYVAVLALFGVIPVQLMFRQITAGRAQRLPGRRGLGSRVRTLAAPDAALLRRLVREHQPLANVAVEREEPEVEVQARLVALLRLLADLDSDLALNWTASRYLLFDGPYGERDYIGHALIKAGTDPIALDRLEQMVGRLRRLPGRVFEGNGTSRVAQPITVAVGDPLGAGANLVPLADADFTVDLDDGTDDAGH